MSPRVTAVRVETRPALLRWTVALLTLWLDHRVTHGFVMGVWAY